MITEQAIFPHTRRRTKYWQFRNGMHRMKDKWSPSSFLPLLSLRPANRKGSFLELNQELSDGSCTAPHRTEGFFLPCLQTLLFPFSLATQEGGQKSVLQQIVDIHGRKLATGDILNDWQESSAMTVLII